MEKFETEEQQAEAIKQWFKENGRSLFTTILVAGICVFGFKYWRHHQEVVKVEASEHYMAWMMSQMQEDEQSAQAKASTLIEHYPSTPYAQLASLYLAKAKMAQKEVEEAKSHLEWVMNHPNVNEFALVARARLARVYLNEKQLDKALELVSIEDANGYTPMLEELKGDIYVAQSKNDEAIAAYQAAMRMYQTKSLENPLLKLKLLDLGGAVPDEVEKENA